MTPRCGQCGYATVGLTTLTCPECGGDLRRVGITLGHDASPATTRWWFLAIAYTLLVVFIGLAITAVVGELVPKRWSCAQAATLSPPSAAGAWRVVLTASAAGAGDAADGDRLPVVAHVVRTTGPAGGPALAVDFVAEHSTAVDAAGGRTDLGWPIRPSVVARWLAASGLAVTDEEAAGLCLACRELSWPVEPRPGSGSASEGLLAAPFPRSSITSHRRAGPPPWVGVTGTVAWAAVWLAGLAWFVLPRPGRVSLAAA